MNKMKKLSGELMLVFFHGAEVAISGSKRKSSVCLLAVCCCVAFVCICVWRLYINIIFCYCGCLWDYYFNVFDCLNNFLSLT